MIMKGKTGDKEGEVNSDNEGEGRDDNEEEFVGDDEGEVGGDIMEGTESGVTEVAVSSTQRKENELVMVKMKG